MTAIPTLQERFTGCLLGGAVGDALGAPVEFMRCQQILEKFGPEGISEYSPAFGGLGRITDDTQMTLFTAEGLLRADVRGMCHPPAIIAHAYLRWLVTQGGEPTPEMRQPLDHSLKDAPGWLIQHRNLHHRRAPGNTCLSALQAMQSLGDMAIAVYCALVAKDFRHGVTLAVNHDGDSDSTGAIAGNLLGVMHGVNAIPTSWLEPLELREVITEIAQDLLAAKS